jgi:cytochrome c nitrite reductase small subunit
MSQLGLGSNALASLFPSRQSHIHKSSLNPTPNQQPVNLVQLPGIFPVIRIPKNFRKFSPQLLLLVYNSHVGVSPRPRNQGYNTSILGKAPFLTAFAHFLFTTSFTPVAGVCLWDKLYLEGDTHENSTDIPDKKTVPGFPVWIGVGRCGGRVIHRCPMIRLPDGGIFRLMVLFSILSGVLAGVGLFTFYYAHGFSYLGADPKTCVNCHIMSRQFEAWEKSSHHKVATCVDCHLPHQVLLKYLAKGENGYHHSKAFTLQNFHEPIMIKQRNSEILQENCLRCHGDLVHDLPDGTGNGKAGVRCVHCHQSVGHGESAGLGGSDRGELKERMGRHE